VEGVSRRAAPTHSDSAGSGPVSDTCFVDRAGIDRDRADRRYARLPLERAVEDLNRVLPGWSNYFRYGNSGQKFDQIDAYVNERLAILASVKHGLTGRNWVTRFNHQWVNQLGVYRLSSKVTRWPARASR
jgi:RNA-directed DNA polymerase